MIKLSDKSRENVNRLIDSVIEELKKAGYDVSTLTESYAIACVHSANWKNHTPSTIHQTTSS